MTPSTITAAPERAPINSRRCMAAPKTLRCRKGENHHNSDTERRFHYPFSHAHISVIYSSAEKQLTCHKSPRQPETDAGEFSPASEPQPRHLAVWPLWVKNGPDGPETPLPLCPNQRTSSDRPGWSGSCQQRT